jgi:3-hydroxyisobutyrate dehydrogenase-like beta-hydroxyacid dehydrogenase
VTAVEQLSDLGSCDVVGVCVTDGEATRAVVEGLVPALRSGAVVCVHSTVAPGLVLELADHCGRHGVELLDAPVSGGADGAAAGTLMVLCGGAPTAVERARPVLDTLGTVRVMGDVGAGQLTKLVNNALYAAQLALALESTAVAARHGVARDALIPALQGGSGASFAVGRQPRFDDPDRAAHAGWLLAKDLALFEEVAGDDGAAIVAAARGLFERLGSAHA